MIEGKKLRAVREAAGVTQAAVASGMGISDARVSVIESERRGPAQPETAVRFLKAVYPGRDVKLHVHVRAFVDDALVLEAGESFPTTHELTGTAVIEGTMS